MMDLYLAPRSWPHCGHPKPLRPAFGIPNFRTSKRPNVRTPERTTVHF
jgi:hypothetical protein